MILTPVVSRKSSSPVRFLTILTLLAALAPVSVDAALVAHWKGDGDFLDSAGTSPATAVGSVTFAPGLIGQAMHFPDAGYLEVVEPLARRLAPSGAFTIAAFVRVDGNDPPPEGGPGSILSVGTTSAPSILLAPGGPGRMDFVARTASGVVQMGSEAFDTGRWRHVAATYDPANRTALFYADGERVMGFIDQPNIQPIAYDPGILFHIGKDPGRTGTFDGLVDDLRFYDEALDDAQVQALSVVPEPVASAPLLLALAAFRRRRAAR